MSAKYTDCPAFLREFLFYMLTIKGRSQKTADGYYLDLKGFLRYINAVKKNISLDIIDEIDISTMTVDELKLITLHDTYSYFTYVMTVKNNASSARSRKASAIRSFFKYLTTKANLLEENPVQELEMPSIKKALPKYLTLEESLDLLNSANSGANIRDFCIITLFLNCGMRLSELVGINLTDIRGNQLKLLGKGNKERIVYLNTTCINAIEHYKQERALINIKHEDKNALFISRFGKRITGRRVEQIVSQYLQITNLSGYSPHKLRHTAATLMYQHANVDIRVLKEILGHVSLSTTEIYTHVSSKQVEDALSKSPLQVNPKKPPKIDKL